MVRAKKWCYELSRTRLTLVFSGKKPNMAGLANLIWSLIVILFVLWLVGLLLHIGGGLIHLILVVCVVLLIINLLTGRGARV